MARTGERGALMSAYQRYDFMAAWQRHVGSAEGVTPGNRDRFRRSKCAAVILWPFGTRRFGGAAGSPTFSAASTSISIIGLWRRDFVAGDRRRRAASRAGAAALDADVAGAAQSAARHGHGTTQSAQPVGLMPNRRASATSGELKRDFEALIAERAPARRPGARICARRSDKLSAAGGVTLRARRRAMPTRVRLLDVFFKQKSARMRQIGHARCVRRSRRAAVSSKAAIARMQPTGRRSNSIRSRSAHDVIATIAAALSAASVSARCSTRSNQAASRPKAPANNRSSIWCEIAANAGSKTFDLGIGEARYKNLFCQR